MPKMKLHEARVAVAKYSDNHRDPKPRQRTRRHPVKEVRQMTLKGFVVAGILTLLSALAFAECPDGTWPRDQYSGPGGGAYTGPGGGLYTGPRGGASTGPGGGLYKGPGGGAYTGPGGGLYSGPGGGLYRGPGGGLYSGPGGGLYSGPGGGLYTGPGGGMYRGPSTYCSNIPPWPFFVRELEQRGMLDEANRIRSHLRD